MSLPFVISVPHGSAEIPQEIRPRLALSEREIDDSTDLGTREIFGSLDGVEVVCSRWSRLVVDLNRDPSDRGPQGVIALVDYFGRRVYPEGRAPDEEEVKELILKFYRPYHDRLRKALSGPRVKGLLDCHSLSGTGPPGAPDPGRKRKDIVLSNNGDLRGERVTDLGPPTCPPRLLHLLRDSFVRAGFSVSLNAPYTGGFISTHYGHKLAQGGKFAIQIEINQDLFSGLAAGRVSSERLARVRSRVHASLYEFADEIYRLPDKDFGLRYRSES